MTTQAIEEPEQQRRTQQERRNEAENALLDAAAELISEQGIVQTSLAQIGHRAGYSRGLVNHHFGTKDALINRLVQRSRTRFLDQLDLQRDERALDTLFRGADAYLQLFFGRQRLPVQLVLWGAAFAPAAPHGDSVAESETEMINLVVELIKRGQEDGSISGQVDPTAFAFVYQGMLRGVAAELIILGDTLGETRLRREVAAMIERCLRAPEPAVPDQ